MAVTPYNDAPLLALMQTHGFTADETDRDARQDDADDETSAGGSMSANGGDYELLHVFKAGDKTILLEQNTGPEDLGGYEALVKYPPVITLIQYEGTQNERRVAVNAADTELLELLLTQGW